MSRVRKDIRRCVMRGGEKHKVKMIEHFVGDGRITVLATRDIYVPEENLDPSVFVETEIDKFIDHGGRSYRYLDCVKESYVEGSEKKYIFYVRYRLDSERENFRDFVQSLRPADFMSNNK